MRGLAFVVLAAVASAASLAACANVAGIDVTYTDAGAVVDGAAPADAASDGARFTTGVTPPIVDDLDGGCGPCSEQGQLCCAKSNTAECIDDAAACDTVLLGCANYDPGSDSWCCWNGGSPGAAGSFTAFAADCGSRPLACVRDSDCPAGSGPCHATTCGAVVLGVCGGAAPTCP